MPENMDDIRAAIDLLEALPVVNEELGKLQTLALRRAYTAVGTNTLTPDLAYGLIMELYSYHQLATKLSSRSYAASNTLSAAQKGDMNVT